MQAARTLTCLQTLFEYTAANDDELSFKPGQLIRLLSKEDGGWWKGELEGGKSGWFPDNFVEPARYILFTDTVFRNSVCQVTIFLVYMCKTQLASSFPLNLQRG